MTCSTMVSNSLLFQIPLPYLHLGNSSIICKKVYLWFINYFPIKLVTHIYSNSLSYLPIIDFEPKNLFLSSIILYRAYFQSR